MARYTDIDDKKFPKRYDSYGDFARGWNACIGTIFKLPIADVVPKSEVAREIFDAFDKAIGSCEAWDHLPVVLLQLLAELKQKYSERSNDDNRTEHKETPKR